MRGSRKSEGVQIWQRFFSFSFLLMRGRRIHIPLKVGHNRPASKKPFKWRSLAGRWWPDNEYWLGSDFPGGGGGPDPCPPSWSAHAVATQRAFFVKFILIQDWGSILILSRVYTRKWIYTLSKNLFFVFNFIFQPWIMVSFSTFIQFCKSILNQPWCEEWNQDLILSRFIYIESSLLLKIGYILWHST